MLGKINGASALPPLACHLGETNSLTAKNFLLPAKTSLYSRQGGDEANPELYQAK